MTDPIINENPEEANGAEERAVPLDSPEFLNSDIARRNEDSYNRASHAKHGVITDLYKGGSKADAAPKATKETKAKKESRAARWARVAGEAYSLVEELKDMQSEFEAWRDNLPENFQGSALGEKLDTVCDIDLDGAIDALDEAQNADLPLGFGRD